MTFDFFEGAAGTGKTHSLLVRAAEISHGGVLAEGQKLLALTRMNGARIRLEARLNEDFAFRRRFACQTFDVFARTVAARRRSLIAPETLALADTQNDFDGPCALAADLLRNEAVRYWVARSFPLVLIDEAQDLDDHRLQILQMLSLSCRIVAAADAFQCLDQQRDTTGLMAWLEGAGQSHHLTTVRRTNQRGLLDVALAVRQGRDVTAVLRRSQNTHRTTWSGQGFRIVEAFATNSGIVARTIADEISYRAGSTTVLSPNMSSPLIQGALNAVDTRVWQRSGLSFGPFPLARDQSDDEAATALLASIILPDVATYADLRAILAPLAAEAPIAQAIGRMDRMRRAHGQIEFTAAQVATFVREAVRNRSRLGFRPQGGHLAMTIQRAKNREFPNVIVLWPYSVSGSPEHLRRLLYNGITRAQIHCTVIVLGQNRLNAPPFAA